MLRMRAWSVRHAKGMQRLYAALENGLFRLRPLWQRIGYERLDKPFVAVERVTKGFLFDSKSCGQCVLGKTGMSCPMNCPKELRNGPCGGVRPDGTCEIEPAMDCVWVQAWEGDKRLAMAEHPIQEVLVPVDARLRGTSAWLREVRRRAAAENSGAG